MKSPYALRVVRAQLVFGASTLLGACASPEVHFYTLAPAPDVAAAVRAASSAVSFDVVVLPVHVPAQVDRSSLVFRGDSAQLKVLENEHWAAPLSDEIRAALVRPLTTQLGIADVSLVARSPGRKMVQLSIDVQRFDLTSAGRVTVAVQWSARFVGGNSGAVVDCHVEVVNQVGTSYVSIISGYQRSLSEISVQMGDTLKGWDGAHAASCAQIDP